LVMVMLRSIQWSGIAFCNKRKLSTIDYRTGALFLSCYMLFLLTQEKLIWGIWGARVNLAFLYLKCCKQCLFSFLSIQQAVIFSVNTTNISVTIKIQCIVKNLTNWTWKLFTWYLYYSLSCWNTRFLRDIDCLHKSYRHYSELKQ